jgi:sulfoxide reductase catalytic subunit YedY
MSIKSSASIPSFEITDKHLYMDRRTFMRSATALATAVAMLGADALVQAAQPASHGKKLENVRASSYSTDERPNTWEQITSYNNYYEFGTDKEQPARLARTLVTEPWTGASATSRRSTTSKTCSREERSKIACIDIAASKRGRW